MLRYFITDGTSGQAELLAQIRLAINAGVDLIQIRQKAWSTRELLALLQNIEKRASKILVNERLDVALAAGADGVHLPAHSLAPLRYRALTPPGFLIAVSCHLVDDVIRAQEDGADFTVLGPIFPTPSKLPYGEPLGLRVLHEATHRCRVPVFALGGINVANREQCARAGAHGIAGIRLFQEG